MILPAHTVTTALIHTVCVCGVMGWGGGGSVSRWIGSWIYRMDDILHAFLNKRNPFFRLINFCLPPPTHPHLPLPFTISASCLSPCPSQIPLKMTSLYVIFVTGRCVEPPITLPQKCYRRRVTVLRQTSGLWAALCKSRIIIMVVVVVMLLACLKWWWWLMNVINISWKEIVLVRSSHY